MFELTFALKYLVPRKKALSTALISLMSVLVISLVVWLVLIFLSVTSGIERNWLTKLTSLHAPIRISPTPEYYKSYYYQVDALSASSHYTLKTIGEKVLSPLSYSPTTDMEVPAHWPKPETVDPIKKAMECLSTIGLPFEDYEISGALLKINRSGSTLSQMSYLLSAPKNNPSFKSLILASENVPGPETAILLPKNYREAGVKIGDTGTLNYSAASVASMQEQRLPVKVSGFYDPGMVSIGSKCVIVPSEITRTIHAASQTFSPDGTPTNGIFVWCKDLKDAPMIKEKIEEQFALNGISSYWKVDTYRDFEFSKDLMQQFQSDKTLFLLIAAIILIVACSNIISLLVLLVNDKKKEIAIIQSMGASFKSIAAIFGICGMAMGVVSCLFGTLMALFTLYHLDTLVSFLSFLQGHSAFNPAFFGQSLPNQLSSDALLFVLIATPILSLAAGLIPAIKASRIHPSTTLRTE